MTIQSPCPCLEDYTHGRSGLAQHGHLAMKIADEYLDLRRNFVSRWSIKLGFGSRKELAMLFNQGSSYECSTQTRIPLSVHVDRTTPPQSGTFRLPCIMFSTCDTGMTDHGEIFTALC